MNLHQVLTGAVNPGDNCYSVGSVQDIPFTVRGFPGGLSSSPLPHPVTSMGGGWKVCVKCSVMGGEGMMVSAELSDGGWAQVVHVVVIGGG